MKKSFLLHYWYLPNTFTESKPCTLTPTDGFFQKTCLKACLFRIVYMALLCNALSFSLDQLAELSI